MFQLFFALGAEHCSMISLYTLFISIHAARGAVFGERSLVEAVTQITQINEEKKLTSATKVQFELSSLRTGDG